MRLANETAATNRALEGSLIEVCGLMFLAGATVGENLITVVALERLFPSVDVQVLLQRPFISKLFSTVSA